jgi:hypothetical protein
MSVLYASGINSCTTACATYLQNSSTSSVAMATATQITGGTFASNPWASSTASSKATSLAATISSNGSITATAPCKLTIQWSGQFVTTSAAQQTNFYILPTSSNTTLTGTQIYSKSYTVASTNYAMASGGTVSGLSVAGTYIAKTGDTFVLGSSDANMSMHLGILQLITEPLISL